MAVIDVVIVNYHSAALVHSCVQAVHAAAASDRVEAHVVVVNNSDDGLALQSAVERAGGATIVQNIDNLGFGAACNIGARRGSSDVVLFLNPDATIETGCLAACLGVLSDPAYREVGIVGPAIYDLGGLLTPSCSNLPTVGSLLARTLGLHMIVPEWGATYLPLADHRRSHDVGQVMGAVMFIRRDLFTALGGFDESFFLYYEDVDLSARSRKAGSRSRFIAEGRATHLGAGATARVSAHALALHVVSRAAYGHKHFGATLGVAIIIAALFVEFPARLVRACIQGGVGVVLKAYGLVAAYAFAGAAVRP